MGGCCCCSSRKSHLVGTPVYYYCPQPLEERGSLGTRNGVSSAFTAGFFVDLGLETSIPDTFHVPAPLPYDLLLGRPDSTDSESVRERISETLDSDSSSFETLATCEDLEDSDSRTQASSVLSPRKSEVFKQNGWTELMDEEEDSCPICLEDYDAEHPKLMTKCDHHFHLSCLLEWIERSERCPICDQLGAIGAQSREGLLQGSFVFGGAGFLLPTKSESAKVLKQEGENSCLPSSTPVQFA